MPHADSAYVPEDIRTCVPSGSDHSMEELRLIPDRKEQFYHHVTEQLTALLNGSRYWVCFPAYTVYRYRI